MSNKQVALDFLNTIVAGKIDEAYEHYVDMSGKHHNVYYPAGFSVLKQGMKDSEKEFPNKKFKTYLALEDGDLVAVYSHVTLVPKEKEVAVVHMFRIQGGRIVEMWDTGQILPQDMPNSDGAF